MITREDLEELFAAEAKRRAGFVRDLIIFLLVNMAITIFSALSYVWWPP